MPNPLLLTDWLTICTAGPTIDGRTIQEQWLIDAAETYDREEYAAFLNCEHWYGNLGTVWELRTGKDKKGRTNLQARIKPNKYFLQQNAEGLRLCYSAEFMHDFAKSGKSYLSGLATTDMPASLATTETHFNRRKADVFTADPVELDLTPVDGNSKNLYSVVKQAIAEFFTKEQTPPVSPANKQESSEMTKEEFQELMKPFSEKLNDVAGKVDAFAKNEAHATDSGKTSQEQAPPVTPVDKFDAKTEISKLTEAVTTLSGKLDEALKDVPPKGNPAGTGESDDEPLI